VILRSGKQCDEPSDPRATNPGNQSNTDEPTEREDNQPEKDKEGNSEEVVEKRKPYVPPPPYKPHIPYPQRFEKSKSVGQFKKFVV
jgi:hypothetical protein